MSALLVIKFVHVAISASLYFLLAEVSTALLGNYVFFAAKIVFFSYLLTFGIANLLPYLVRKRWFLAKKLLVIPVLAFSCLVMMSFAIDVIEFQQHFVVLVLVSSLSMVVNEISNGIEKYWVSVIGDVIGSIWVLILIVIYFYSEISVTYEVLLWIWLLNALFVAFLYLCILIFCDWIWAPIKSLEVEILGVSKSVELCLRSFLSASPLEVLRFLERFLIYKFFGAEILGVFSFSKMIAETGLKVGKVLAPWVFNRIFDHSAGLKSSQLSNVLGASFIYSGLGVLALAIAPTFFNVVGMPEESFLLKYGVIGLLCGVAAWIAQPLTKLFLFGAPLSMILGFFCFIGISTAGTSLLIYFLNLPELVIGFWLLWVLISISYYRRLML